MNYLPMNEGLLKDLLERGFANTNGCYFQKVAGMYTLRVWVHNHGGQAEVTSRVLQAERDEKGEGHRSASFKMSSSRCS